MMRNTYLIVAITIIVAALIIFMKRTKATTGETGSEWKVFGTMGCGWTRKQLEYMKEAGKSHTFIDCDKEECKGIKAYPTTRGGNGEEFIGYKEV